MHACTLIGVDLAKNVFSLHGVDNKGRKVFAKRMNRKKFQAFIASSAPVLWAMEACSGSHYWARLCFRHGHQARLISPQYVKAFVKTNKNDAIDAEAICEAAMRPSMRFVPVKSQEQLDIQAIHRIRWQCVHTRTARANQIRGHLREHGIVLPEGIGKLRTQLPYILEELDNELTLMARDYLSDLYADMLYMDERVEKYNRILTEWVNNNEACKRLMTIPGVKVITATILYATAGDGSEFKNGRHFAAWLGLTPRQHSTGGRNRLLGISKHGDPYIRTLLVQGAHNLVRNLSTPWIKNLVARHGHLKACVAQANKTARIAWAVLAHGKPYSLEQAHGQAA